MSPAVVIATGVTPKGGRKVLDVDVGDSEDAVFWIGFFTSLKDRGLTGVEHVISDARRGIQASICERMRESAGQLCRVHLLRNVLAHVPREQAEMVAAFVRMIFHPPHIDAARRQLREVDTHHKASLLKAAAVLAYAKDDVIAYSVFPRNHLRKILPTNLFKRVNREIKRRINAIGVFPQRRRVLRLVGAIFAEQNDKCQTSDRLYLTKNHATVLELGPPNMHPDGEGLTDIHHSTGPC